MSNLISKIFGLKQSPDAYSEDATIQVLDRAISEQTGNLPVHDDGGSRPQFRESKLGRRQQFVVRSGQPY